MRHVWLVPLEKRQQREPHDNEQQGHLDDAGQGLFFNPCIWQQQVTQVLDSQII